LVPKPCLCRCPPLASETVPDVEEHAMSETERSMLDDEMVVGFEADPDDEEEEDELAGD
jgi:hypothetical protein